MYQRFSALAGFDEDDANTLQNSTAAVVGLGATGSVIAENLARHGVKLVLIDRDFLESKDLYSSSLYTPEDVEKSLPKAYAAEEKLEKLTEVESHNTSLRPSNTGILENADIVLDGTDNLETRFLISDLSNKNEKPWIYTAAIGEKGYSKFFGEDCFNCVFEEIQAGSLDTCESSGIMREVSQIVGSRSAMKAVRYLTDKEVEKRLEIFPEGDKMEMVSDSCPVCRGENYPHLEESTEVSTVCGEGKFQITREEVNTEKAFEKLRDYEIKAENDYLIRSEIDGREFVLFRSGRAIVEARNRQHAFSTYSEILGI